MTRTHRPAEQLPLALSVAASVTLQQEIARCEAYAAELAEENARLTAANATLTTQIEALKKEKKSWERSYKKLKAERDALAQARLSEAAHPLHQECVQLRREVESLRAKLFQRVWQELEALRSPGRVGTALSKADLTKLLTIAHPDKWQHQPAETLAHELAVAINAMRKEVQA